MKTYVLLISATFPTKHPRAGEETGFEEKIEKRAKIHTIRKNIELWQKRIDEVNSGQAIISVRQWSGRPYNSKQVELCRYDKDSSIGVQAISMHKPHQEVIYTQIEDRHPGCALADIAKNDGLAAEDFRRWFFPDASKPDALFNGVIIHFTKFRY